MIPYDIWIYSMIWNKTRMPTITKELEIKRTQLGKETINLSLFAYVCMCAKSLQFSSVQSFSRVRFFATPWTAAARPPCPSPTPGVYSNSCPLSRWCHSTISSSAIRFSSHLQSFPASESFPISHFFASGGQSIGVSASASVLPMNIQGWFPLGWTIGK